MNCAKLPVNTEALYSKLHHYQLSLSCLKLETLKAKKDITTLLCLSTNLEIPEKLVAPLSLQQIVLLVTGYK